LARPSGATFFIPAFFSFAIRFAVCRRALSSTYAIAFRTGRGLSSTRW
jgi:hypothetical protein